MNIENIREGDFLVVLGSKSIHEYDRHPSHEVFGGPVKVRAISVPYLCISDLRNPKAVKTLDTRFWHLSKANVAYVKAFEDAEAQLPPEELTTVVRQHLCPVCAEGLFAKVCEHGSEPYWQCQVCESVIVQRSCQA